MVSTGIYCITYMTSDESTTKNIYFMSIIHTQTMIGLQDGAQRDATLNKNLRYNLLNTVLACNITSNVGK